MRKLQTMASMVDGKVETALYLEKEGVLQAGINRLLCTSLNPTRSAYLGSDGCKKK